MPRARPRLKLLGALLVAAACDVDPGAALDGRDAGGGARDAETRDVGRPDGGQRDAETHDAGLPADAGLDGSTPDAAEPDPDPSGWCERDAGWPQREPAVPPFPLDDGPSLGPVDTEPDLPSQTVPGARIEPPDLGFGGVTLNQTATVTVELVAAEAGTYAVASPPACPAVGPFCARFTPEALEAGDRYVFDVAYRPTAPAGRDRASVEVTSDGVTTRRIPVDGMALDRPAVDCWAPTRLDPLAPGEVATFEVRCSNAGLGPAVLTELTIESDVQFVVEGEPLPRPASPASLIDSDVAWTVELRPEADSGAFETTVRWRGASAAGGPGVSVGAQTVRAEVVPGQLELPASLVVPVRSRGDDALLELRNVGLGTLAIDRVEIDGPFEVAEETVPASLGRGERAWIRVRVAPVEAVLNEVRTGALRLFTDGEGPREVSLQMDPPQAGTCQLDVPGYTDLGRVRPPEAYPAGAPTQRDLELTLGVQNVGDGPCLLDVEAFGLIDGVTPLRSNESGEAPTPSTSMWLFPGEADFLRLAPRLGLAPGKHVGRVEFVSRGEPGVRAVARFGAELTPTGARVRIGAPAGGHCARLGRYSVGLAGVEVASARWVSDADDPVFVRGGGPGYRTRFDVDRGDDDPGLLRGMLRMQTSGGLVQVPLAFGRAAPRARRQVDRFQAPRPWEVDVLFVVDDSASMARWHPNLARNLMDFVNFADAQRLDYRLMLTRTATGALVPLGPAGQLYLGPDDTPERRGAFVERAVGRPEAPRAAGLGIERPVEAALRAIDGARGGALREDAVLSVVVVTDEADRSPVTLDSALDALLAVKGRRNTHLLSFSVISGGDTGCRAGQLAAAPTLRLVELARRTGGVAGRLCSPDWSRVLEDLRRVAFGVFKSRYFLTNPPIPETVEVEVNGLRVPATCSSGRVNWTFDFSTDSVNFTPLSVPPPGADVRIEYDAGCL